MKNLGKRLLSFAMALLMVLSMVPAGALGNHAHATASGNVAEVNGIGYTSLADAITAAGEGDTVKVVAALTNPEVTIKKNVTIDLEGNTVTDAYWIIDKAQVTVENGSIKNTQEPYPLVAQNGAALTINNVAIEASKSEQAIWVRENSTLVFNSGSILVTKGENNTKSTISAIKGAKGADITINGGTITVDTPGSSAYGVWANYDDVTVTVNGGKISTTGAGNYNYAIYTYGDITVKDGEIVTGADGKGSYNYALYTTKGNVTVEGGSITTNGNNSYAIYASGSAPQVSITGGEFVSENASTKPALIKTNSSSVVTATIEGGVFEGFDATLLNNSYSSTNTSTVTVKGGTFDVKLADKYIATGATVTMAGTTYTKNEEGELVEVSYAAKINGVGYTSLADALAAAKTMTGDVVVEIYDKVTLNTALSGSFDSVKFVGKDTDAEIYLDVQGYTTATGKKVAFEGLILSKAEGGYVANAGFMNLAFGVYDVVEVTYTGCTFANGAYASSGKVTFTGCTFYRSHDRYGMWAYGDVDAIVDNCTFADFRGIKMYAEGGQKVTNLTVKNSDFSAVNNKPAIVLTHGESVVLENNTYSETGVFELDLDGAPNGTPVTTDDVANLTCKNDNGACGVLVDGKIYTTVAQAAAVAAEGDTIILLHDSAENVELPDGVALDLNGHTAAGITLAGPKGTVTPAYTGEVDGYVRIWGEGGGNAKESYVLKLFAGDKLIATTQLNNVGGIIDGNVYVTWNFFYPASTDEYWTTTWEAGQPNSVDQPTKVELYLDGVKVSENVAKMSGADDLNPVVWENLGGVQKIVTGLQGAGTEADPYLIGCVEELLWFQAKVDEQAADGSTQFAGKYFKLTADIDLAGINWNPIGSMSGDHGSFKGVFDGDGHTIKNLNCQQAGNGIGLFARTAGNAQIKNLTLENVTVKSTNNANYVGGVVGNAYASTKISNVHVKGQIDLSGCGYIGGIAGHGYVVMDNVSVVGEGTVYSTFWCAGGILGYAGEGATNITNAHVEGLTITSAAGGLGAIVGMAEDNNGTQPISGANLSAKNVQIKTYTGAYGDAYADYALGYLYGGNPTSKLTGELTVDNVSITTSNGVTPSIVDAVATVDSAVYFDLQSAIDAAEGKTVKVLRDITLTEALTVTGTVTLDLAGYDMTVANDAINLHIYGKLTIEDSVGGGVSTYRNHFVHSGAELVVNGGTLQNVETATGGFPISTNDGNATVTINGGTVQAVNSGNYAVQLTATSNLTVNGGTIQGHWGAIHNGGTVIINDGDIKVTDKVGGHCIYVGANAVTTVNGGTYTPNTECASYAVYVNGSNAQVTITDGTFNTGWNNCMLGIASEVTDSMIAVKGGTFSADPAAYCADGYIPVDNGDGTYGVKVTLPEVVITDVKNTLSDEDPDLTFALNFAIANMENLTDEYLNELFETYGDYYVDYVLTIDGLNGDTVTFNANGTGDGYLAGQYDAWSKNWVTVPFDDVVVEDGQGLYIMEYAAKLMNKQGLRFTLAEVATIVQNFDCGVYFTPEFLAEHPDLEVSLQLKVFTEDAEGNKIENIDVATNEFENNYAAIVTGEGKQTQYFATFAEAYAAAQAGDTIVLLKDVKIDGAILVNNTVVLELSGFSVCTTEKDTNGDGVFHVVAGGDLTINGEGTINGVGGNDFNIAIWADGGKVTINGGYYTNVGATDSTGDTDFDLIYVKNGGEVVINGGKFEAENPAWILNSHDTAKGKISVYGGEFVGFNPMNNAAEGANTNFMADGLHAADVDGDGIYTVHAEAAGETVVENNVAPDCENAGSYDNVVYCEVCGHEMSRDTVTVDALGHSYTNYIYNNNATTSADGTETAACDHGCGKTDTRVAVGTKLEANNVAYIIVDGEKVYYESVQDAIDMAMDGQTVYLNADAREVSLDVYENITLDLNGYTLTVTRQATANGEIKGEGLLAAPKNKTILNGQVSALPVWNGSGYYFAAAPDMSRAMMYNGQFVFQPQLSSDIAALFAAGTADDAALHIVVTLTYELSGKTFTMEYEVTEDTTMDAYKKGKTMGLIIEEDFTNLTFTVKVESDTGAVFSAVTVS